VTIDHPTRETIEIAIANGARVAPVAPGKKVPALESWPTKATDDPATIERWWTGPFAGHGVCIVTGTRTTDGRCLFVVDVDQKPGIDGYETLADLIAEHGDLPDTLTTLTPSGGSHLYFVAPHGVEIRNNQSGKLGPGLDIRGEGGQVVAPPSVHPTGARYEWALDSPLKAADAPQWLIDLLTPDPDEPTRERTPPRQADPNSDRPGDQWAAATSWADLLTADGWRFGYADKAAEYWARPGKEVREGVSASVGFGGYDLLKVFTSSLGDMGLAAEATYSKLGYLAATRFGGDHHAAASWLVTQGWGTSDDQIMAGLVPKEPTATDTVQAVVVLPMQPEPVAPADMSTMWHIATADDIAAVLGPDYTPPKPTIGRIADDRWLYYPGKVHSLAGEPNVGKTWIALLGVVEVIKDGQRAMVIDYEDTLATTASRLRTLGLTIDEILTGLIHITPEVNIKGGMVPDEVADAAAECALVVIDSVGEALAACGLSQDADGDVAQWMQRVPRRLAARGPAVVLLDHLAKNSDTRGRWAIGSQRKLAAIDGAAYGAELAGTGFSKTKDGFVKLVCNKDRGGNFANGTRVATLHFQPSHGQLHVDVECNVYDADAPADHRPTHVMEKVNRLLHQSGDMSARKICDAINGRAEITRKAIDALLDNGSIERVGSGAHVRLRWVWAWSLDDETMSSLTSYPQRVTASQKRDAVANGPDLPRPAVRDAVDAVNTDTLRGSFDHSSLESTASTASHRVRDAVAPSDLPRPPFKGDAVAEAMAGKSEPATKYEPQRLDFQIIEANLQISHLIQAVTNRSGLRTTGLLSVEEHAAVDRALAAIHRGEYTLQHFPSGWHLMPATTAPMEFI